MEEEYPIMADKILLNNQACRFSENELPCLVTYRERSGGSHFTVALAADLFLSGSKILFFTAYPMARDNFLAQIAGKESRVVYVEDESGLAGAEKYQAIILKSGDETLFRNALDIIPDIKERVVLVKNFESFSDKTVEKTLTMDKYILSGDLDKWAVKEEIVRVKFNSIVVFSKPEISLELAIPELERYQGYFWSKGAEGLVKIGFAEK